MFRSYEPGREDFVTLVANYLPLQDPYGGPELLHDGPRRALRDPRRQRRRRARGPHVPVPLHERAAGHRARHRARGQPKTRRRSRSSNVGPITAGNTQNLNVLETYTRDRRLRRPPRPGGGHRSSTRAAARTVFAKPVDNIGTKSIPDYAAYARAHVYDDRRSRRRAPAACSSASARIRSSSNLGETFDLVNPNPLGAGERRRRTSSPTRT